MHRFGFANNINIAPTQPVAVVTVNSPRTLHRMRWGLVPAWADDVSIGNKMINARAETLEEKPAFRQALKKRRCLIPADGFYEWQAQGKAKQPMYIRRKDKELFAFAGLWEENTKATGEPLRTCVIITTTANALMQDIHQRMPAMLLPELEDAWLDHTLSLEAALACLKPYPAELMEAYPVSKRVNAPIVDDPALLNSL